MKKYILAFGIFSVLLQGCSDFESTNTNPNQPGKVPAAALIPNILYTCMGEDGDVANSTGMYSTFVGGDMGGCWAQHLSKVQYNDEERYKPRGGVVQDFWETIYEDVVNDANKMNILATEENNKNLQGIALVLKAYGFSVLTDCYGDIPFSEALKVNEGILKPKYDKQEDVYTGILALLDEAQTLLAPGNGEVPSSSDVLYKGDITKWKKFAGSLKFRCLMRISSKKNVAADLQAIVNSGNLFASNGDDAEFIFNSAQPTANPFYETVVFGNRAEWKVNSVLVEMLTNIGDPRLPVYAQKAVSDGTYRGKPSGYNNVPSAAFGYKNISAIGTKYLKPDAPGVFMSYAELCFLMAEAKQRGLISTGSVEDFYNKGISASMAYNGISASDIATYITKPSVMLAPGEELQKIAEQKWLALFGQGIEAWTEWRRTKFPELSPAVDAVLDEIPSRYQYPSNEQSINADAYNAAVTNQGPDLLTTKIWWLKP
ncbi:MAG: SusD/RagB family nutrient-binding outer membrane lipoprotein [Chitinophagales bacterium]